MTLSRRQFLATTGGGALAAALGGCASSSNASSSTRTTQPLVRLVDRARFGSYVNLPGVQANPIPSASLEQFEALLGRRFDIVHYFFDWSSPFAAAINANVPDRDLMISWAPPGAAFAQILAGSFDAYIANYARAAKAYRHPVYLRLAGEMNGNWNSYSSAAADGPSAKSFKLAWHRVVGIFRAVHAKNVKFIWCPTEVDSPDVAGNHLEDYWPGSNYVDVLGFDSYNRSVGGKIEGGGGWRTFNEMCASGYGRVAALDDSMPIWLCETGCTEAVFGDPVGVTKGAWFNSMFQSESYPRLSAVVYFSSDDTSLARDWRIDTTAESVQGWKRGWHS